MTEPQPVSTNDQQSTPDDVEFLAAEQVRYDHLKAPSIDEQVPDEVAPETLSSVGIEETLLRHGSSPFPGGYQPDVPKRSSRMWPIAAALIVGLSVGFGGGYFAGGRQRVAPAGAEVRTPTLPSVPPSAREYTEGTVAQTRPEERRRATSVTQPQPNAGPPQADKASSVAPERTSESQVRVKPDTANAAGELFVRSTPADATVFVDGRERGRTPAAIHDLARGTHRVRIVRDGYVTENRRIVISRARPAESMTVTLDPRVTTSAGAVAKLSTPRTPGTVGTLTGALDVDSRPTGARVFLDGKLVGLTPVAVPQVTSGDHVVRLESDGYRGWTSMIRVMSGQRNRVTASLER